MEAGGEHGSSPGRALKSVRSWDTACLCPAGTLGEFYSYPTCIRGSSTCRVGGSHPSPRAGAELLLFQLDLGGGDAQQEVLPNILDFPKASVTPRKTCRQNHVQRTFALLVQLCSLGLKKKKIQSPTFMEQPPASPAPGARGSEPCVCLGTPKKPWVG